MEGVDFGKELDRRVRHARYLYCEQYGEYPDTLTMTYETLRAASRSEWLGKVFMYTAVSLTHLPTAENVLGKYWGMKIDPLPQKIPLGTVTVFELRWVDDTTRRVTLGPSRVGDLSPAGKGDREGSSGGDDSVLPASKYRHTR